MRRVSTRVLRGAALFVLVTVLAAPASYADNQNPYQPPEAKIGPPIGATSQARIQPPIGALELLFLAWLLR